MTREQFWGLVEQRPGNECWPWRGSRPDVNGYSKHLTVAGCSGRMRAHRVAFSLTFGERPFRDGLLCLHNCDNPLCCRPDHLRAGTQSENIRESVRKGRWPKKVKTLSDDDVRQMRRMRLTGYGLQELSKIFNVSRFHVSNVCNRRYRTNVT